MNIKKYFKQIQLMPGDFKRPEIFRYYSNDYRNVYCNIHGSYALADGDCVVLFNSLEELVDYYNEEWRYINEEMEGDFE